MRLLTNFAIIVTIGLTIGAVSAQISLQQSQRIGAIKVGPWSAWPFVGGVEVDPYTAARRTANGTLHLGAAEGLAFEAFGDQSGETLRLECHYEIDGITPPARIWTLAECKAAYRENGELIIAPSGAPAALHSANVVRFSDNSFQISVNGFPTSGNWMGTSGSGPFKMILRIYDTPITSNIGIVAPQMPQITRKTCL